ncbi:ATP-grasp domain-containing protein [Methanobacterium aggregans]|uniref:ATP-grasp domain-containing protein n=1 Tax=Methanobacterium aggregans TaxID=1615586 RepID=UPI001AE56B39|nr:ATP-grasp domain-containing protein [Methanobacterium aggregans]MBP2046771.1 carbamoyl-phosphate synthase large subunit [Methanobacterium aggregans]
MKVAVTGVGGGVGQSIIKALNDTTHELVGIDSDLLGAGLYGVPCAYLGHYANKPQFIPRLQEICEEEECEVLFPGLDAELPYLARNKKKMERKTSLTVMVSDPSVVEIADDKLETYYFLEKNGFPALETYNLLDYNGELNFPVVVKPRKGGARSVDKTVIKDNKTLESLQQSSEADKFVIQEYAQGTEYTCGTVSLDGDFLGPIIMKRQLRCGDTYKAFVIKDDPLENHLKEVIEVLNPYGPCNVQLRMDEDVPYIFEFNARCSGTTASRALAGFNEPAMVCDYIQGKTPQYDIKDMVILRYWNELVVEYAQIENMGLNKHVYSRRKL